MLGREIQPACANGHVPCLVLMSLANGVPVLFAHCNLIMGLILGLISIDPEKPTWIEQKYQLGSSKNTNLHRNYPSLSGYQNASEFCLQKPESLLCALFTLRYLLNLAGQDQLGSSKKTNLHRAKRPTWIEQNDQLGSSKNTNLHRNYPS